MRDWLKAAVAQGLLPGGTDDRDARDSYRTPAFPPTYTYIVPPPLGPDLSADEANYLRRGALLADLLRAYGPALLPALAELLAPEIRRIAREILAAELAPALAALRRGRTA